MRRYLSVLEAGFNRLTFLLAVLVAVSIGLIAVLIPLNLLLTNLRLGGLWWLYEAIEYALYVGVFIGAPWVLHLAAHVRVDIVVSALPARLARRVDQASNVFGALLCLLLCYYGSRAMLSEFAYGTLPDKDLRIDNWYMLAVYSFSMLLLAIEFLFRINRSEGIDTALNKKGGNAAAARPGF